jgi:hypothetical protein
MRPIGDLVRNLTLESDDPAPPGATSAAAPGTWPDPVG